MNKCNNVAGHSYYFHCTGTDQSVEWVKSSPSTKRSADVFTESLKQTWGSNFMDQIGKYRLLITWNVSLWFYRWINTAKIQAVCSWLQELMISASKNKFKREKGKKYSCYLKNTAVT